MKAIHHRVRLWSTPPEAATRKMSADGTITAAAFVPAMGQVQLKGKNRICLSYDVSQASHRELVQQLQELGWNPRYIPDIKIIPAIHDLMETNLRDQAEALLPWQSVIRYAHFLCGADAAQRMSRGKKLWRRHLVNSKDEEQDK